MPDALNMKHEFAEEQQLRATVALLGVADVRVHAVLPGLFRYSWPCGCEVVSEVARREWSACNTHDTAEFHPAKFRSA
jgi:hypothetical protein